MLKLSRNKKEARLQQKKAESKVSQICKQVETVS